MKTLNITLTIIFIVSYLSGSLSAESEQPDPVPDDIESILPPYFSDAGPNNKMTAEEEIAWKAKIDATPDVTNRLFELFCAYWDSENDQQIPRLGKALVTRRDLSLAQQGHLAGLIKKLDAGKMTQDQLHHWGSLLIGLKILENYPSPEHEEIVLEILNSGNRDYRLFALKTISKIGSERSIRYVRRLMEVEKQKTAGQTRNPKQYTWYDNLEGLEKQLVQREEKKRRDKERDAGGTNSRHGDQQAVVNDGVAPTDRKVRWAWGISIALAFLVVACIAILRGMRSKHALK